MQLLVSVVNDQEATSAVTGGADIIDVKNPGEGSLGANFPGVIKKIRKITPEDTPVSAAIGDAPDLPGLMSLAALGAAVCKVQYIKIGLYGVVTIDRTVNLLKEVKKSVKGYSKNIKIVAVAYGDAYKIGALSPPECVEAAVEAGIDGCMLDTVLKGEGDLFSSISVGNVNNFLKKCKNNNLISALAGSLTIEHLHVLKELGPDIIGFRGAVCNGDRVNGSVNSETVRSIKNLM